MLDHVFKLQPSKTCSALVLGISLLSTVVLLTLKLKLWLDLLGGVSIGIYAFYLCRRYSWQRSQHALLNLQSRRDGAWVVTSARGSELTQMAGESIVTAHVCILRYKLNRAWFKHSCVIFPDSLPAGEYRKLLVALRLNERGYLGSLTEVA